MKIFVIGSEGSGKTVLLTMLSRFVANHRMDVVLEPEDFITAQYVTQAQAKLEIGEWPESTLQGKVERLRWKFGRVNKPLHSIEMFDSAGQDLRSILLEEDLSKLSQEHGLMRSEIDWADVLVFLFDPGIFFESRDLELLNENAWLFKTFLTRSAWQQKQRLVVVSKADIYEENLNAAGSVREMIKQSLPKNYSLVHLLDQPNGNGVHYLSIACVRSKTVTDEDGNPRRAPGDNLESSGLDKLIDSLSSLPHRGPKTTNGGGSFLGCLKIFMAAIVIGCIILLIIILIFTFCWPS